MKPKFRIKENSEGKFEVYYVEKIVWTCKGQKEVLKPFITWSGLDTVYPFSTIDLAIDELKLEVIKQTEKI